MYETWAYFRLLPRIQLNLENLLAKIWFWADATVKKLNKELFSSVEWAQRNTTEDDYSLSPELMQSAAYTARRRQTFGEVDTEQLDYN